MIYLQNLNNSTRLIMTIHKLTTHPHINDSLFNLLLKFNELKELRDGKLILSSESNGQITIDLADIFIFNSLLVNGPNSGSLNIQKHSYAVNDIGLLNPFIVFLSNKFPQIVLNNQNDNICASILSLTNTILKRLEAAQSNDSDLFFIEECASSSYINIVCNGDCYFKINFFENRFLLLYKDKVGLGSFHFLNPKYKNLIISNINKVLTKLGSHAGLIENEAA